MMKSIFKYSFILLLVAGISNSCSDLETPVFSELTSSNFPTTDEQFTSALGATYTSLQGFGGHNSYWSGQMNAGDESMIPHRGADWFDGGQWLRCHRHEFQAEGDPYINNAWSDLYGGISNCNRVIELFENLVAEGSVTQEAASSAIAEVKVLRAYFYTLLLDFFGNVPVNTAFAGGDPTPPTKSRSEVFSFIESELNESVPLLTKTKDGTTYGRFNFWSGKALQCRLYLNAEVYTGSARWNDALAAANEIINSGLYSLESDYFTNFNVDNIGSSENIFVIPYDNSQNCCFQWVQMTLHYQSQQTFETVDQPWNGYCAVQEFYDSYADDDLRKGTWGDQKTRGNFLAGPQFTTDGATPITDANWESKPFDDDGNPLPLDPDGENIVFTPELNEHFPGALRQGGVRIGKYQYEIGTVSTMNNDFVLFRYSEVLLNKAEALYRTGGSGEALGLINMIRARANVADMPGLDDANLLAERGRELAFEGIRRSDQIRFGQYGSEWNFKPSSDANKTLFPIPQEQLNANPNLQQNPGY